MGGAQAEGARGIGQGTRPGPKRLRAQVEDLAEALEETRAGPEVREVLAAAAGSLRKALGPLSPEAFTERLLEVLTALDLSDLEGEPAELRERLRGLLAEALGEPQGGARPAASRKPSPRKARRKRSARGRRKSRARARLASPTPRPEPGPEPRPTAPRLPALEVSFEHGPAGWRASMTAADFMELLARAGVRSLPGREVDHGAP